MPTPTLQFTSRRQRVSCLPTAQEPSSPKMNLISPTHRTILWSFPFSQTKPAVPVELAAMAPPNTSAFCISKVQNTHKNSKQEVAKKKERWSDTFSFWTNKLSLRNPEPPVIAGPASTKNAEKVLGLPELLGNVLKHVPSEDLLTSKQLVNCTWKNTIARTPAIKTKLWQKVRDPRVARPYGTTQRNGSPWADASYTEVAALTSGVPAYNGHFAINMLAVPTSTMRKAVTKKNAALAIKYPPPPPAPQCPIKIFRGLIRNNFPSLSFAPTPPPVPQRLVKPLFLQTSIEPTPRGGLVNVGFRILRSLCRGYHLDRDRTKVAAPQPAWLRMFVTDPPVSAVWISMPMWTRRPRGVSPNHTYVNRSLRIPSGVTFGDVRDAVGKIALADARPCAEISLMEYDVRVCFVADGLVLDGEVARPVTEWVDSI